MFRFLCLISFITFVSARSAGVIHRPIVGGHDADVRQYPHMVSINLRGENHCGGSIYNKNIIVTAAHCVRGQKIKLMSVAAGSTLLSEKNQEIPVFKYVSHSRYNSKIDDYDIAIIVLRGHLDFNQYVQPIALAEERPLNGTELTVTGWGYTKNNGEDTDQLQAVELNYIENAVCKNVYTYGLTKRMICAAVDGGGKDSCQGDSGGPLIYQNKLLGVVSSGGDCGLAGVPGVYSSIPDLRDWIIKTADENQINFS